MENNNQNTAMVGFESFNDLLQTIFGLKHKALTFYVASVAATSSFITNYIWDDSSAVYFLVFLLTIDFITGVWKSIKSNKFCSSRLPRAFVTLLVYCLMLSIGWNAAKYSIMFIWLPGVIYGGLISTLLVSVIENLMELGYLPKELYNKLKKIIKSKS
jgi:phage-related holin